MPFRRPGHGEFGTYFIGYSRTPRIMETMLQMSAPNSLLFYRSFVILDLLRSAAMETGGMQSKPNWYAILTYYFLACLWSWPLFWWRDAHSASWNALPIPPEFQSPLIMWGPGLAAIVVFFVFPQMRSRFLSLQGSSWKRSVLCFLIPICFAYIAYAIESKKFSWKLGFDLVVWGFACLGEELGWRGFLQGALRPLGRVRGGLLLSLMWTAWHFTTTREGLISHLEILLPAAVALAFVMAFLTERTGSLALAVTLHAWVDLWFSPGGYFRWAAVPGIDMDHLEVAETQRRDYRPFAPVCRRHSLIAGGAGACLR